MSVDAETTGVMESRQWASVDHHFPADPPVPPSALSFLESHISALWPTSCLVSSGAFLSFAAVDRAVPRGCCCWRQSRNGTMSSGRHHQESRHSSVDESRRAMPH